MCSLLGKCLFAVIGVFIGIGLSYKGKDDLSVRRINLDVAHPDGYDHYLDYEGMSYIPFTETAKNNCDSAWRNAGIILTFSTISLIAFGCWTCKKFSDLTTCRDEALREKEIEDQRITSLQDEITMLRQRNVNLIDINLTLKEERNQLREECEKEKNDRTRYETHLTTMELNLKHQHLEIQAQAAVIKSLRNETERLEEEVLIAKNFKDEENCNLLDDMGKEIGKLEAKMNKLNIKCDALELNVQEKKNEIRGRDLQILQLQAELQKLRNEITMSRSEKIREIQEQTDKLQVEDKNICQLQAPLLPKEEKVKNLRGNFDKALENGERLQSVIEGLKNIILTMQLKGSDEK